MLTIDRTYKIGTIMKLLLVLLCLLSASAFSQSYGKFSVIDDQNLLQPIHDILENQDINELYKEGDQAVISVPAMRPYSRYTLNVIKVKKN